MDAHAWRIIGVGAVWALGLQGCDSGIPSASVDVPKRYAIQQDVGIIRERPSGTGIVRERPSGTAQQGTGIISERPSDILQPDTGTPGIGTPGEAGTVQQGPGSGGYSPFFPGYTVGPVRRGNIYASPATSSAFVRYEPVASQEQTRRPRSSRSTLRGE